MIRRKKTSSTRKPSGKPKTRVLAKHVPQPTEEGQPASALPFPVVGIGASAGGLEAFTEFLRALPADTGMAFVLVSHLSPSHPSHLAEILARVSSMPVTEVEEEPRSSRTGST
jgi:two-component system CheB/CheR fusion protein